MSQKARITVTLPRPLVAAADERARALDRSRSWVVARALERCLSDERDEPRARPDSGETTVGPNARGMGDFAPGIRERSASAYRTDRRPGLGPRRREQLEADLRLSPEERVREAERTARVLEARASPGGGARLRTFDRYEDYLDWRRREELVR